MEIMLPHVIRLPLKTGTLKAWGLYITISYIGMFVADLFMCFWLTKWYLLTKTHRSTNLDHRPSKWSYLYMSIPAWEMGWSPDSWLLLFTWTFFTCTMFGNGCLILMVERRTCKFGQRCGNKSTPCCPWKKKSNSPQDSEKKSTTAPIYIFTFTYLVVRKRLKIEVWKKSIPPQSDK